MSFWSELNRRNVVRVGAAYAVGSWLIVQIAETIFPLFGFGSTPARITVIVLTIGFLPTLVFAWAFELTPEGVKREKDVERFKSITKRTGKQLDPKLSMQKPSAGQLRYLLSLTARRIRKTHISPMALQTNY